MKRTTFRSCRSKKKNNLCQKNLKFKIVHAKTDQQAIVHKLINLRQRLFQRVMNNERHPYSKLPLRDEDRASIF